MPSSHASYKSRWSFLALLSTLLTSVSGFALLPMLPTTVSSSRLLALSPNHQQPGESSSAYWKRLATMAASETRLSATVSSTRNSTEGSADNSAPDKPTRGYVRAEEWEKQLQQENSWEQKVKFDGQRFGNRFQQNEILLRSLKSF